MNWFQRKPPMANVSPLRAALFADATLAKAGDPETDDPDTPAAHFHSALASLQVGDRDRAKAQLVSLLDLAAGNAALTLQVWSCLRELGGTAPPGIAGQALGVVVEFGVGPTATDIVAAYADRTARLIDHRGHALSWMEPDGPIDDQIAALLAAAWRLADRTQPGPRPAPPAHRAAVITVLTCGGLHAVQGQLALLERDTLCSPVLNRARALFDDILSRHQQAPRV